MHARNGWTRLGAWRAVLVAMTSSLLACGARTEGLCGFGECAPAPAVDAGSTEDVVVPFDTAMPDTTPARDTAVPDIAPPATCPADVPRFDTPCTADGLSCRWPDACGHDITGRCDAGTWIVELTACGTCPLFTPTNGAHCGESSGCVYTYAPDPRYLTGATCRTPCRCGSDHVWSCAATVCE